MCPLFGLVGDVNLATETGARRLGEVSAESGSQERSENDLGTTEFVSAAKQWGTIVRSGICLRTGKRGERARGGR